MQPPPPTSRQNSYAFSSPSHIRSSSYRLSSHHDRHASSRTAEGSDNDDRDVEDDDEEEELRMEMELEEELEAGQSGSEKGLEDTLEKLGMGTYHWRLLALCGFGWMSDNSALTCIAVILPRVQIHFDLSSHLVGLLSASTMAGMMLGAVGWGTVSDILGRTLPFNATLFLAACFGIGASFAPSFGVLCVWMFFLGSAVGGSMPTDGTLFLENLPHSKQYLLTLLSVFFSFGSVLSSVISYAFLPSASCGQYEGCDIEGKANEGWRRVLLVLGMVNMGCALARWLLFRLHESPRYLVAHGRESEALTALQAIAKFNGKTLDTTSTGLALPRQALPPLRRVKKDSELPSPAHEADQLSPTPSGSLPVYRETEDGPSGPSSRTLYDSVGLGPAPPPRTRPIRLGSAFYSASHIDSPLDRNSNAFDQSFAAEADKRRTSLEDNLNGAEADGRNMDGQEADGAEYKLVGGNTTSRGRRKLEKWKEKPREWWASWRTQLGRLFVPKWRRTVILMWIIWGSMSFSYTMFNVWLPAVLESRAEGEGDEVIREALKEFMLYAMAGCPGSILGAWMIQTSLGRRKSLAICTIATGLATFAFLAVSSNLAVTISSMLISTAATAMYAVLYGMTPETFGTSIRGTACGTSAALSRLTGVMAPVSAGFLLTISPSLPVFTSASIFFVAAGCSLALPFERVGGRGGSRMAH